MVVQQQYNYGVVITPSNSVNFTAVRGSSAANIPCAGIYVGGAGVVAVVFEDGAVVNFTAPAGTVLPLRAIRVNSSNTTATLLVALYAI